MSAFVEFIFLSYKGIHPLPVLDRKIEGGSILRKAHDSSPWERNVGSGVSRATLRVLGEALTQRMQNQERRARRHSSFWHKPHLKPTTSKYVLHEVLDVCIYFCSKYLVLVSFLLWRGYLQRKNPKRCIYLNKPSYFFSQIQRVIASCPDPVSGSYVDMEVLSWIYAKFLSRVLPKWSHYVDTDNICF